MKTGFIQRKELVELCKNYVPYPSDNYCIRSRYCSWEKRCSPQLDENEVEWCSGALINPKEDVEEDANGAGDSITYDLIKNGQFPVDRALISKKIRRVGGVLAPKIPYREWVEALLKALKQGRYGTNNCLLCKMVESCNDCICREYLLSFPDCDPSHRNGCINLKNYFNLSWGHIPQIRQVIKKMIVYCIGRDIASWDEDKIPWRKRKAMVVNYITLLLEQIADE